MVNTSERTLSLHLLGIAYIFKTSVALEGGNLCRNILQSYIKTARAKSAILRLEKSTIIS